jgi:hypothetical protein
MALKVAVIGLAASQADAPWDDPEWEKWGLAWDGNWPKFSRTFEMHDDFSDGQAHGYVDALAHRTRLYMQEQYPQVPGCTRYPFEAVAQSVSDYWVSSISYVLSLAIHEGAEEIGLWGVDMDPGSDYFYQKANCEYLIGLARGRGIKVHIPDSSPLCKFTGHLSHAYAGRYGRSK